MNGSVVISDTFLKSAVNASIYTCLKTGSVAVETTCYESIEDPNQRSVVSERDEDFEFNDGGCCESNSRAVCCIISLNKAMALRYARG